MGKKAAPYVLIVDDNEDLCWLLEDILKGEGFRARYVTEGEKALAAAAARRSPDVVLLDIRLGKMNGIQVLEQVKSINGNICVIMLTAYGEIQQAVKAMQLGASDFVTKPFDNESLLCSIRKALKARSMKKIEGALMYGPLDEKGPVLYSLQGESGSETITRVSGNVSDLLGCKVSEIAGSPGLVRRRVHPRDLKKFDASCPEAPGETSAVRYRFKCGDGSYRWLSDEKRMFVNEKGEREIIGAWKDVSARKLVEDKMLTCRLETNLTIKSAGRAFSESMGIPPDEMRGKCFFDPVPGSSRPEIMKKIRGLTPARPAAVFQCELAPPQGERLWVEWTFHAHFDKNGRLLEFEAVGLDRTAYWMAAEKTREYEVEIERKNLSIREKEAAFREVLEHIEEKKREVRDELSANINEFALPLLERLKMKNGSSEHLDLLHSFLTEMTSPFGRKISDKSLNLSPREIEICGMLKGGLSTKELSSLMNVSLPTIEKHRKNIRKKLGISNRKVNLVTYLQSI